MARAKPTLFLARASYRRRRLRDAARLLPILGLVLLQLPLLWMPKEGAGLTSTDVVYFFVVWLALIGCAAGFAPGLRRGEAADGDGPGGEEED